MSLPYLSSVNPNEQTIPSWRYSSPTFLSAGLTTQQRKGTFRNSRRTLEMDRVDSVTCLLSGSLGKRGPSQCQSVFSHISHITLTLSKQLRQEALLMEECPLLLVCKITTCSQVQPSMLQPKIHSQSPRVIEFHIRFGVF